MLSEFISALGEYKIFTVVLILVIILTAFVSVKAYKAAKKRNSERNAIIKKLDEQRKLREDFKVITPELISVSADDRLLFGTAANIQQQLEMERDMETAFDALNDEKKLIYALNYVFEDSEKSFSNFFRANGKPLTPWAKVATEEIIADAAFSALFDKEYAMFDSDDETVSFETAEIERIDAEFSELFKEKASAYFKAAADYIKQNQAIFLS